MISKKVLIIFLGALLIAACSPSTKVEESPQSFLEEGFEFDLKEGSTEGSKTIQPQSLSLPLITEELISPGKLQAYSFISSSGQEREYILYLPDEYYERSTWPVIIFLHGDRQTRNTVDDLLIWNPRNSIDSDSEFPFVLIAPVSPTANWKFYYESINELLDAMTDLILINSNAIILTGESVGAYGAWNYALSNPDHLIAFAPVAGGLGERVPDNICLLKDLPIWIFESEADLFMLTNSNFSAVKALEDCGNNSILKTTFTDLNHIDTIESAYADVALYEWMLKQVK